MKKLVLFSTVLLLGTTGCATVYESSHQNITISTYSDSTPDKTQCVLKNEEGEWRVIANNLNAIHRDGNTMNVDCENESQRGHTTIDPHFQFEYVLLDLLWDACLLTASCIIDGVHNAYYEYPYYVHVEMKEKQIDQPLQTNTDQSFNKKDKTRTVPVSFW